VVDRRQTTYATTLKGLSYVVAVNVGQLATDNWLLEVTQLRTED
jgi:hypothetical protein